LPLELIPDAISSYLYYNPLQVAQAMLRKLFLFSLPVSAVKLEIFILSFYFVLLFLISMICDSYLKRQTIYHFFHRYHKKKEEKK
jgi:ABC-type polysaccharide/polyol phosphate export permease